MFGAIAGGIASALAGGAMSKLFGGGQKAASGGTQGDVLATDNNTVGMGDAGIYHFYRSAHKFEQICRHRLRRQNVGYSNFSQPQSHLSFCVLLQYLVERRRVVTQLGKLD